MLTLYVVQFLWGYGERICYSIPYLSSDIVTFGVNVITVVKM